MEIEEMRPLRRRILHYDQFQPEVLRSFPDHILMSGYLLHVERILSSDLEFVQPGMRIIVKQYDLGKHNEGFMRNSEALNTIKSLKITSNGSFPRILSSDITRTVGEVMMTYVGQNLHKKYNLPSTFADPLHADQMPIADIVQIARDILS